MPDISRLQQRLEQRAAKHGVVGAQLGVVHDGQVRVAATESANLAEGTCYRYTSATLCPTSSFPAAGGPWPLVRAAGGAEARRRDSPSRGPPLTPVIGPGYLLGLFGVIISGAVLPVVPTGAAVSAAAALARLDHPALVIAVVAAGAAGAYASDLLTYGALRFAAQRAEGSPRITRWLVGRHQQATLGNMRSQLRGHELRTLLLSRLVPGGQLPVLVAAALGDYPWRRYALVDLGAATLWSVLYACTGLAGRAIFPRLHRRVRRQRGRSPM